MIQMIQQLLNKHVSQLKNNMKITKLIPVFLKEFENYMYTTQCLMIALSLIHCL
jgi:hypothetical protein